MDEALVIEFHPVTGQQTVNPQFRVSIGPMQEWPESIARKAADFHIDRAEHHAEEERWNKAEAHKQAAQMHVQAAFYFQRARLSEDNGKPTHAENHTQRANELMRRASDYCEAHGIEHPESLTNTLGVSRGEGTKVGGF